MSDGDRPQSVAAVIGLDGDRPARRRRWLWAIGAAVSAVGAAAYLATREPPAPAYVLDTVERGRLVVTVTATGTLQPTNQVDVGSEVSGLIDEVLVDFNDAVEAGDVLARLDTETLEARAASARASLAVAEASLLQAEATAAEANARAVRAVELAGRNLMSQQELEAETAAARRAEASVASARAQVTSARAALQEAETALGKAVIRAPISGIVISREVEPGQTVAAAFQTPVLFKLAEDLTRMQLHLDVDESDIGQVREGQRARFRVDAYPNREFEAEIVAVRFNPRTINNIVTYETVLSVDNPDLLLRPGMTATADILVAERADALLVPNRALRFLPPDLVAAPAARDRAGHRVWSLEDGKPVELPIVAGIANDEHTEVLEPALEPGTEVIVDVERPPRPAAGGPFG